jgi:hypothetical protein
MENIFFDTWASLVKKGKYIMKYMINGFTGIFLSIFLALILLGFDCFGQGRDEIKARIDIKPNENQVEYSPADGSTVNVNPPPFTWLPVKKDITLPPGHVTYGGREFQEQIWVPVKDQYPYSLQISRDSTFRSDVITRRDLT